MKSSKEKHHEEAYDDADDFGSRADGAKFQRSGDLHESGAGDQGPQTPQEGEGRCVERNPGPQHFE